METVFRKEIKYLISRREAMILQQKLDGIMERDIHGENGRYFIRSQYYDSIDDQDLWDNLDGMYEKRKIRLRIYSLSDLSAKLEFKCKNGSDGVKYSIPVSREQALQMEQGDASFLLEYETELAMRLYLRITQGCYRPKTIIDYQRLAFAYPAGDVRITFDTDIRGTLYPYGLFEDVGTDALGSTEQVLMEVKYTGFLPDMIAETLKEADELSTSHSKYSMDNWVDYFIINEFAMNYDAGNLSTYVYKELGGKLQLAVWDFNNGFDNYQWFRTETDALYTVENSWFERLWQDKTFRKCVCERYRQLRKTTLSDEYIYDKIAFYQEELGDAVDRNFKVWGYSFDETLLAGTTKEGTSRDIGSYEEAVKQLTDTIHERLAYLDKELGGN